MRLAIATWLRASERSSDTGVSCSRGGGFDAAGAKPKWPPLPSRPGAAPRTSFAVARGEGKDCLAKAPRCQQIARSAASKSENDSMTPVVMTPVVAVIAPGIMGAAVGKRLTDHGLKVLTSLQGRSAETRERAQAAGMVAASDEEIAATDFILSILPPGDAVALAQRFAGALTASNSKPVYVDCNAVSPSTVERIAAAIAPTGSAFVDAGIIGAPPKPNDSRPRFYASGPDP